MPILINDNSTQFDKSYNAVNIILDATDESALNFEIHIPTIKIEIANGNKLFFEFHFGLDPMAQNFKDQMQFLGFSIAITTFIEKIYEPYKDHIQGVFLYRGIGNFSKAVESHCELIDLFEEFASKIEGERAYHLRLFSLQVLMEYLHRLGAMLPEELLMYVLLNFKGESCPCRQAQMLAANHYPYIKAAVKGALIPYEGLAWESGKSQIGYIGKDCTLFSLVDVPSVALLLPEFGNVPVDEVNKEIERLNSSGINYKIIPEEMLNESWHLIDDLIVFDGHVSFEGKRMIDGFIAAGGLVKKIGVLLEDALSE